MIFKNFLARAILTLVILQGPLWALADVLAPFTCNYTYESILQKVVQELGPDSNRTTKNCADIVNRYNLSWLYLTDTSNHILVSTRPSGLPELLHENGASRVIDLKGKRFVELSQVFERGAHLTIGVRCPSLLDSLFSQQVWPVQLPIGTVLTAIFLNSCILLVAYFLSLSIPLQSLIRKLASGQELSDKYPAYVSAELTAISHELKKLLSNLKVEHDKSISALKADITTMRAREFEDHFVNSIAKEIAKLRSSDSVTELVLRRLAAEFNSVIKAGFVVNCGADSTQQLSHHVGYSEEQTKHLAALDTSDFNVLVKNATNFCFLRSTELADKRLAQLLSDKACNQFFIVPIEFKGQIKAHLCFLLMIKDQSSTQKLEQAVTSLCKQAAPALQFISDFEDVYRLSRYDYLTGVRNRLFLEDTLSLIGQKNSGENDITETNFLIFEGDNFSVIRASYGPITIDKLIQELSRELLSAFDKSLRFKKASSHIRFADFFYRLDTCRFMLILEDTSLNKSLEMAEFVLRAISEKKDWVHRMPSWSVSCAISTLSQTNMAADCLEEAMITLDYIRSKKQIAVVVSSQDVPPEYMARAQTASKKGGMIISDPVALLQTVLQSQKDGILTVTAGNGRSFWSHLENGRLMKARLGKLCGDGAVVEFICEFQDAEYHLQDFSTLDALSAEEVNSLGGAYIITTAIPELIEFSMRSKESAALGKMHLKIQDMTVHPNADKEAEQIEKLFFKSGKSVNKLYLEVANKLWNLCNGRFKFDEIIAKMQDEVPLALVWSAADFFLEKKLIKFSRFKVASHTDGLAEQQVNFAHRPAPAGTVANSDNVQMSRACTKCRINDPLSQRYCVHCGSEMLQTTFSS